MKHTSSPFTAVLFSLLASASISHAAVVFDGAGSTGSPGTVPTATTQVSWSHTVTASTDSILMVAFSYEDPIANVNVSPAGITYGTAALTQLLVANAIGGTNENYLSIWYLLNPTPGTATITLDVFTLNSATAVVKGSSASFSGVTSAPTVADTKTDARTNNTVPSVSFTGVASGSALYVSTVFSGSGTLAGTTTPLLTFPSPGGSLTGGQSAQATGYNLNVSGDFTVTVNPANQQTAMGAVILVPEPSSMLLGAVGALGLLRRRRSC